MIITHRNIKEYLIKVVLSVLLSDLSGNIVATLLDSGADPNTVMSKSPRMTCLHTSVLRGRKSAAEILIGRGADVNAQVSTHINPHAFRFCIQLIH